MRNKPLTQQHLKKHPEKIKQFDRVYIWSGQWNSYWMPKSCGYTHDKEKAGIYEAVDALKSTIHCGPEKKIVLIPFDPQELNYII